MFKTQDLIEKQAYLRQFALKLTKNEAEAEDLFQHTIMRALEKKHLFKAGSNVFSWASKIMYNLFISSLRKRSKFMTNEDPSIYIENLKVEADQDKKLEFNVVRDAIRDLSDEHQEIIKETCIQGKSYEQVADELNIPVGTVRSRLHRAREILKENLVYQSNPYYGDQPHGCVSYSGNKTAIAA